MLHTGVVWRMTAWTLHPLPSATLKRMDHPQRIQVAAQLSSKLVPWAPHNTTPDVLPSTL